MRTKVIFICDKCDEIATKDLRHFNENQKLRKNKFCSRKCVDAAHKTSINDVCKNCGKSIEVTLSVFNKSKSKRFFCSKSCGAIYNNKHKTHGTRRSKLEKYIEERLLCDFPSLTFDFNKKTAIEAELDVYCSDLKIGIEINGVVHYEPIYGLEKLEKIKTNDKQKMIQCYEKGIELIVVNAKALKYVTKKSCEVYYQEIKKIFETRLGQTF